MSRAEGAFIVLDEEVWGVVDHVLAYVGMRKLTVDFNPNRMDKSMLWLGLSFLAQVVMRMPSSGPPRRPT